MVRSAGGTIRTYAVGRELGRGGRQRYATHEGHDVETGKPVAIKLPVSGSNDHPGPTLETEAATWRRVGGRHPALLTAHGLGVTDEAESRPAFVMDLAQGARLGDPFEKWSPRGPGKSVRIAMQILGAAQVFHEHGLRHGDIHPGNVMIDEDRSATVRLIDFGAAVPLTSDRYGKNLFYSAPRRSPGENTDSYSVGAILIKLLTGEHDLGGLTRIRRANPDLARVIGRAVDPVPRRRYRSPKELLDALAPFSRGT
jgi:serine/threonine protein kinase